MKRGRALRTLVPPATTESWYSPTRVCKHCRASITIHRFVEAGQQIVVMHEAACAALGRRQ